MRDAPMNRNVRVHQLLTSLSRVETDPASTRLLGQLGGGLFVGAGALLAVTMPFLPGVTNLTPLIVSSVALITCGLVAQVIPWERWPREAILVESVVALAIASLTSRSTPGGLTHYLQLYSVVLLYVGLCQRVRVVLMFAPAIVVSYVVGTLGLPNIQSTFDFWIAFACGLLAAVLLSYVVNRFRIATDQMDLLLRTTRGLSRTTSVADTVHALELAVSEVIKADACVTFLAVAKGSDLYTAVDANGTSIEIDIKRDVPKTSALLQGDQVFIPDVSANEAVASELLGRTEVRSLLCVPLSGEDNRLGALVVCWNAPKAAVDPLAAQVLGVIANDAGLVLERKRETERVAREAKTDPLTGLLNRRSFDDELRQLAPGACDVVVDLDHFKAVNDEHGHQAGDLVLRTVAACMLDTVRIDDACARFGGDEFVMVLRRGGLDGGRVVARQLRASWMLSNPLTTLSIGIAVNQPGELPSETVARADLALYRAKDGGRDRFEVDDGTSHAGAAGLN